LLAQTTTTTDPRRDGFQPPGITTLTRSSPRRSRTGVCPAVC
jgi:hypothetical protein